MRIGTANFYHALRFNAATPAADYDITPAGDPVGLWLGCIVPRFVAADADTPAAVSVQCLVTVGGVVRFASRFRNRQLFRPWQGYQDGPVSNAANVWRRPGVTLSGASGTLIGSFTDGGTINKPSSAPRRSYMHAYFGPSETGPAAGPLGYSVGTVPVTGAEDYTCHAEPVYFWFARTPGQTITLSGRTYREQPNPALAEPINDDLPADKVGAEPDEVATLTNVWLMAWICRVGPALAATVETPATYTPGGGTVDPEV